MTLFHTQTYPDVSYTLTASGILASHEKKSKVAAMSNGQTKKLIIGKRPRKEASHDWATLFTEKQAG
jgi:hypothetical protein